MFGMGRLYTVEFHAVAVTAQQDLFYLKPAADKPIYLEQVKLGVAGVGVDAGDAQEELYDIRIRRLPATVTASSGGGSFTPLPQLPSDTAAGFTARINDTTPATSSGTAVVMDADTMNSRVPYLYLPAPEHRQPCFNAAALCVSLLTTPGDSILVSGTVLVRELG